MKNYDWNDKYNYKRSWGHYEEPSIRSSTVGMAAFNFCHWSRERDIPTKKKRIIWLIK